MNNKFTGKPVIIEGRLALKEINPLGEKPIVYDDPHTQYGGSQLDELSRWNAAESALRTLFVKDDQYYIGALSRNFFLKKSDIGITWFCTITAEIENNELINLEIV